MAAAPTVPVTSVNAQATIRDSYGNSLYHFCHGSEKTLIQNFLGEIAPRVRIAVMGINSGQLSRPAGFIESWTGHYRLQQQEINPRFLATTLSVYPSAGLKLFVRPIHGHAP
ncbi:hypothetical protein RRG08_009425 [Elysia crispata]|uniref:Uncharacterized protein n=1 Tax=Elysia crispata TaxID=231223 RepID=A0AAE0Y8H5_9GAST|nr:hypothetical protein RRG08_009425 [Elysia crispata]